MNETTEKVTRSFTPEQLTDLRQLVREQIRNTEAMIASIDRAGAPWASDELRAQMLRQEQAELVKLKALRRAVL